MGRFGDVCVTSEDNIEATTKVETTSSASPDSSTAIDVPESNIDPMTESSDGSVTVNCYTNKEKSETSTVEWVFIVTLIVIIILLLCLTYVLMQKNTEEKGLHTFQDLIQVDNFEDAAYQKRLPAM